MSLMNRRWTRRAEMILSYGLPVLGLIAMMIVWVLRFFVAAQ
jgi:hypothetical protein